MKELLSTAVSVVLGATAYIAVSSVLVGAPVFAVCAVLSWFGVI